MCFLLVLRNCSSSTSDIPSLANWNWLSISKMLSAVSMVRVHEILLSFIEIKYIKTHTVSVLDSIFNTS